MDDEKKVSGFNTLSGKEDAPFWVVHQIGSHFSCPLIYWTLQEAKKQALKILKGQTGTTVYVFRCAGIYTAQVELLETKL